MRQALTKVSRLLTQSYRRLRYPRVWLSTPALHPRLSRRAQGHALRLQLSMLAVVTLGVLLPERQLLAQTQKQSQIQDAIAGVSLRGDALQVTLEVDRQSAHVNEQILITLQVSAPANAFNITGSKLRVANATLEPLHLRKSVEIINGVSYQVIRRVFALFANTPGTLQIPALAYRAMLPVAARLAGDPDIPGTTSNSNPILTAETRIQQLNIQAAPTSTHIWFPAQQVELSSSWSVDTGLAGKVYAGEPIMRQIAIRVAGQNPAAIPEPDIASPSGARVYPDSPTLETHVSTTGLNGVRMQSVAIVASEAGTVSLPPIRIDWWDINARVWRHAELPAEQLHVEPAAAELESPLPATHAWYRVALPGAALVILGLVITCWILWSQNRRLITGSVSQESKPAMTEKAAWASLLRNLKGQRPEVLRRSILLWGRTLWPECGIHRLDQIAPDSASLQTVLAQLDACLYGHSTMAAPDPAQLQQTLCDVRASVLDRGRLREPLAPLYPRE